ncbi:MAG: FkbM family methyltransferase [Alphaproteobacteria bacterium]|nr:FkbM family methyltransferase [Alphaproteobacteria bacterium]
MNETTHKTVELRYQSIPPFRLAYETEDEIVQEIKRFGAYDRYVLDMMLSPGFQRRIGPVRTVLDIGANIGTYAVAFGKLLGPKGKVIAVEGNAETARILTHNARVNGLTNIEVVQAVLAGTSFAIEEVRSDGSSQSEFRRNVDATGDLRATTIDELCAPLTDLQFIKIDVNGADFEILNGGYATVKRFRPSILIEFSPAMIDPRDFSQTLDILEEQSYHLSFFRGHSVGALEPMNHAMLKETYEFWHGLGVSSWMNLFFTPRRNRKPAA